MKGLKCVIYCRVSSGKQKEEGTSLEIQEERCRTYALEHGMEIKKLWIVDEPATKVGRKAFNEMLQYIQKNDIKHVLCTDTDRLQRNKRDESTIDGLVDDGYTFHFVDEGSVYCSDIDDMMLLIQDIKGAIARAEVRKLKKRTHGSIRRKLEAGEYCGQAPLGYRNVPKIKTYPSHYVQTDDALKVKEFLEIFSTGKYTAPEMVEIAKQMGLKSKRGNELNLDGAKYILKNPTGFYYGEWKYMGYTGKHKGMWEPLVDKKVILRNRAILKQQTDRYEKVTGKEYRFKGLITCSSCGRKLLAELGSRDYEKKDGTVTLGKRIYYHCNRIEYKDAESGEKKKCHVPWILETKVEEEMLRNIGLLEFDEEVWNEMREHLFDTQTGTSRAKIFKV